MQRNSDYVLTEWLVLSAQSGNAAAVNQLLKMWYPKFLRYSARQLNDRDAANDVVQDTLLLVARKIMNLQDPAAFAKWSYRILHRRGVDFQRKEIRRRNRETRNERLAMPTCDDHQPEVEIDTEQAVQGALASLDGASYNLVHLYYLHNLSLQEIAVICRIPVGTVKSRLHTARKKLRKLLDEKS